MANRQKQIAIIKSEEEAQQVRIAADRDAYKLRLEAETRAAAVKAEAEGEAAAKRALAEGEVAQAQGAAQALQIGAEAKATAAAQEAAAIKSLADATRARGEADADAKRKLVDAENQVASKFLLRDIALKALDVLPDVTRELMTPAKAISEVKVLQLQGMGANGAANGEGNGHSAFGVASPVLKTILEAGAAYPLLREMMAFSQVDTDKLADQARAFLGNLPAEVKGVIEGDPALQAKLAGLMKAAPAETEPITARPVHIEAE
jgi:uncharacterized membrane protein YqiK